VSKRASHNFIKERAQGLLSCRSKREKAVSESGRDALNNGEGGQRERKGKIRKSVAVIGERRLINPLGRGGRKGKGSPSGEKCGSKGKPVSCK